MESKGLDTDQLEGMWLQTAKGYRNPDAECALPPRVNHSSALDEDKAIIYVLGGFYEFDPCTVANACATLDCHAVDCFNMKKQTIVKATDLTAEITELVNRHTVQAPTEEDGSVTFRTRIEDKYINVPFMRYGLASVLMNGKIYIYGGYNDCDILKKQPEYFRNFAGVFELDLHKKEFQNLLQPTTTPQMLLTDELPGLRSGHCMIALEPLNALLIFGGFHSQYHSYQHQQTFSYREFKNDLWLFDIDTRNWIRIELKSSHHCYSQIPLPRDFCTMALINGSLVMYGGRGHGEASGWTISYCAQVWIIDDILENANLGVDSWLKNMKTRKVWRKVGPPEVDYFPPLRRSHMSFVRNNSFYIFGGVDEAANQLNNNGNHFSDIWEFSMDTERWREVKYYKNGKELQLYPRRRGSAFYLRDYDWAVFMLGTRYPETEAENQELKERNRSSTGVKEIRLWKIREYDIFAFDVNLKNIALGSVAKSYDEMIMNGKCDESERKRHCDRLEEACCSNLSAARMVHNVINPHTYDLSELVLHTDESSKITNG